jgi:hypothetical protein
MEKGVYGQGVYGQRRLFIIIIFIVTGLTQQCQAFALPVAYSILPNCTNYTIIGWLAIPRDHTTTTIR